MAFVALQGDELVAVARYERPAAEYGQRHPEVAFLVDDNHHRRGLATLLLEYLAAAAREQGHHHFVATVLPENHRMLAVFRQAGFGVETRFDDGLIEVELDITLTSASSTAIADRLSRARTRSVARLLEPTSVAVVGAGRRPGTIGHELARHVLDGGFRGELYVVNPAAAASGEPVVGQRAWVSLGAIGAPIDLVIVAVPAGDVAGVVRAAASVGAGGLLIVSSGFSDAGRHGAEREAELVEQARDHGMRLIGPNAFGLINTAEAVGLRAVFLPLAPAPGPVAIASQSGPLGSAVVDGLIRAGIGVSSFVAVGNRADVSINDLLDYWRADEATSIVLLYVENMGNPRNFARQARSVSAVKPIVTVRPADEELIPLLAQSGVIVVDGVAELAEVASVVSSQPIPAGNRVAVVANTASVARLAVAACRRQGLEVVVPASIEQVLAPGQADGAILVTDADTTVAGSGRAEVEEIMVAAAVASDVDALLVAVVPTFDLPSAELYAVIDRVDGSIAKPVVAAGLTDREQPESVQAPIFTFPDEAARALSRVVAYALWRNAEAEPIDAEAAAVRERETRAALQPPVLRWLDGADTGEHPERELVITLTSARAAAAVELLGLPVAPWRAGSTLEELLAGAEAVGYPVVLKAGSAADRVVGEAGGVAIDLHDRHQLAAAFERMISAGSGTEERRKVVQRMIGARANLRVELIQDPGRGSFVTIGVGGQAGRGLPETVRRYLPLAPDGAEEAVASVPGLDPAASSILVELVDRLAVQAMAVPELARVTLDPLLVAGGSTTAADVEIVIRPWSTDPLSEVRRL